MGVCQTDKPCTICLRSEIVMHSHHTVPQSRGGKDSKQIILCPTCHNSLHAQGVFMVAQIRRNKIRAPKRFWRSPEDEMRAAPYLEILVRALITPLPEGFERDHIVTTTVKTSMFEDIKMLQLDLGKSSLEKTLDYCIKFTLHSKGITNVGQSKKESQLWFLHVPQS
jgi:hypothetical protein